MTGTPPLLTPSPRLRLARAVSGWLIRHPFHGANRLRRVIARRLLPRPTGPLIVPIEEGCSLLINPSVDRGVERELYYQGSYEAGTLHVLRHLLRDGDVFLDIGANIGLVSVVAARLVGPAGQVFAFEPLRETALLLDRNIEINHARNIHVLRVALGEAPASRRMYAHLDVNRGAASLVPGAASGATEEVRVETLDAVVRDQGLAGKIRAIKIDVEGWEDRVLEGGAGVLGDAAAPALIVEHSAQLQSTGSPARSLFNTIVSLNDYRVFRLKQGKEAISSLQEVRSVLDLPLEDNLICLRPSHLSEARVLELFSPKQRPRMPS